eukprot:GEMP01010944.1.p1 GENE.GEMP01010944.1~~GEMP01010944.1.p1  ORF type:complete len:857 (+),score=174.05 GEMP01010944.1:263-2833(+)
MGLLRSSPMQRGTLVLAVDNAREVIHALGTHASVQFEDTFANDVTVQRPYRKHVQRIDECERIVRFLYDEIHKLTPECIVKNNIQGFLDVEGDQYRLEDIEKQLRTLYKNFTQFKDNNTALITSYNATIEAKYVAEFGFKVIYAGDVADVFAGERTGIVSDETHTLLADSGEQFLGGSASFNQLAGVVPATDQARFARFLFRVTRGNSFTNFHEIPEPLIDPQTQKELRKNVFVVYYQGTRSGSSAMEQKIRRACNQFGANLYPWITSRGEAEKTVYELNMQAEEKNKALHAYEAFIQSEQKILLTTAAGGNSLIEEWRMFCLKEKALYHTLNKFQGTNTLRCNVWFPEDDEMEIRTILTRNGVGPEYLDFEVEPGQTSTEGSQFGRAPAGGAYSGGCNNMLVTDVVTLDTDTDAPTHFRTNDFLLPFQKLVYTYGVPRYQEATPVLLTCITFPFIFGIMFGDVGHGTLLLIFGLWACCNAESIKHEIPALYMARYLIAMMGFFALYAGLLYSDMFSVGLDLFGTRWVCEEPTNSSEKSYECTAAYDVKNGRDGKDEDDQGPYPFGLDPAWHGANNELLYVNSLKMKLSVIIGVTQMCVGLVLRFSNAIFERNFVDLAFECIPMAFFMLCFFGFMDYMIVYKWVTPLDKPPFDRPPSIINSMIVMAMGQDDPDPMWEGYAHHASVLLGITMLAIPIMLIPKPVILYIRNKRRMSHVHLINEESGHEKREKFDISEVAIHQVIETIEYALGTVSHTASYLRLWALSLAHQQLANVFFEYTLGGALHKPFPENVLPIYLSFAFWFLVTMGILMGMDTLECFLHALRLHWVEFQSKFYRADGHEFCPFNHVAVLSPDAE